MTREQEETKKIVNRISRIEGQIRGIKKMIESGDECVDVITQINAAREAISGLGAELLKNDLVCKSRNREELNEKYLKVLFKNR